MTACLKAKALKPGSNEVLPNKKVSPMVYKSCLERHIKRFALITQLLISILIISTFALKTYADQKADNFRERLRNRIESSGFPPSINVDGELILAQSALPAFYENRVYNLAWFDQNGRPLQVVNVLIASIKSADQEGLNPNDYHLQKINKLYSDIQSTPKANNAGYIALVVDLELILTDSFLILGSHYLSGKVNPNTIDTEWLANRREADFAQILQNALLETKNISKALNDLLPPQAGYQMMRKSLQFYRTLAEQNQLKLIPDSGKLQVGDKNERVRLLRGNLTILGDLKSANNNSDEFDAELEIAVKNFQKRHGLESDGVAGKATLIAINTPISSRIEQIALNMERWRWLPQTLGNKYVAVNIANYELDYFEKSVRVFTTKVIVGRDYRRTPVFSDRITYLVFNPYWHVPFNLATQDILPMVRKNPDYFSQKKMRVFQGAGSSQKEIDPLSINWSSYSVSKFPFQLRQDPGALNALGAVKFMFPNKFNVYLHDTASKDLFQKTDRAFSSGCIRIQNPLTLAELLLKENDGWTTEKINKVVITQQEQTVKLTALVQIHLLYCTSWVDDYDVVNFRNDVYGRDKLLLAAFKEKPPS